MSGALDGVISALGAVFPEHGFEVFDANGNLVFSSVDSTWTLLAVYTAAANASYTYTNVPIMPNRIVTRHMVGQLTGDDEAYVHSYSLSGSTLAITPPNSSNTVTTFFMVFGK